MKRLLLTTILMLPATNAAADGFVFGAGSWTCERALEASSGTASEEGQLIGWILGFWSMATFIREDEFVDTVEKAGGLKVYQATLGGCRNAPPETQLYVVARSIIENTK